jgi:polysaccharide biosynthesis protein PslG
MHGRLRTLPALLCALSLSVCGLLAAGPLAQAAPPARPASAIPLGGVNIGGLSYGSRPIEADQAVAGAAQLHARVVRVELPWSVLEPAHPGVFEPGALAFVDRLMSDAAGAGITVILTARSTPCWASSAPAALLHACSPTRSSKANAWPPVKASDYAAFVAFIAGRYGTRLAAIEIWNEPDQANQLYFAGPQKPQRYAALVRAAYPAIKQASPSVPVIAGSLVGSNGTFLRALYAAGIKGFYDGLAVHFYNLTLASVRAIHQVQLANGDSKPLWLDEFGWTSCWPRERVEQEQGCVTPAVQALNIRNTFRSLAGTSYIAAAVTYQLRDDRREDFGVLTTAGARKPSFSALAGVLTSPFGAVSPVTLHLARHRGRVVASGTAPVGDFMSLEAFKGSVLRYRALFTLDRFNRYSIALPRVLGKRGLRVRVFQYWLGSARAAQKRL